jgi:hypothetical protein
MAMASNKKTAFTWHGVSAKPDFILEMLNRVKGMIDAINTDDFHLTRHLIEIDLRLSLAKLQLEHFHMEKEKKGEGDI